LLKSVQIIALANDDVLFLRQPNVIARLLLHTGQTVLFAARKIDQHRPARLNRGGWNEASHFRGYLRVLILPGVWFNLKQNGPFPPAQRIHFRPQYRPILAYRPLGDVGDGQPKRQPPEKDLRAAFANLDALGSPIEGAFQVAPFAGLQQMSLRIASQE